MMEIKSESQNLWNMLCGGQVSPKEVPFPTQQDAQDYLNTIIEEGGQDSLSVPPFNQFSLEKLAETLWRFQWEHHHS